jgi:hypothetical protein
MSEEKGVCIPCQAINSEDILSHDDLQQVILISHPADPLSVYPQCIYGESMGVVSSQEILLQRILL